MGSNDDTYTTVAFGTRPASWYRSQGLTMNQPSGWATKDRSVTTDGTQTWDSVGNIIAEKVNVTQSLKEQGSVNGSDFTGDEAIVTGTNGSLNMDTSNKNVPGLNDQRNLDMGFKGNGGDMNLGLDTDKTEAEYNSIFGGIKNNGRKNGKKQSSSKSYYW